jgi:hypothetical protein
VQELLVTKTSSAASAIATVTGVLREYSEKALFRGLVVGRAINGKARFSFAWHHDRTFELVLNTHKYTLQIERLLPGVDQAMYEELKRFLAVRQGNEYPPHRRIDPARAALRSSLRSRNVGITMSLKRPEDYEYATRKLVHLVHEIFLGFLIDGAYYEYMVENLGLDPDRY